MRLASMVMLSQRQQVHLTSQTSSIQTLMAQNCQQLMHITTSDQQTLPLMLMNSKRGWQELSKAVGLLQ
jgi:hypothetical protein